MPYEAVYEFINTTIFRNDIFVNASEDEQHRALRQAEHILLQRLGKYFPDDNIPADMMAHQTIWILQLDDTFARAEMGASYIQMSGVMINIADKDRTICPYVLGALGLSPDALTGGLSVRKVGRYVGHNISRVKRF